MNTFTLTPEIQNKEKSTKFVKDTRDNTLFKELQVKDLSGITNKDTVMVVDFDGIVYKSCSMLDERYIKVTNKITEETFESSGITAFKGTTKEISINSELGVINTKREAEGLEPYKKDDFEIEDCVRPKKLPKGKNTLEEIQILIRTRLKELRKQFGVNKQLLILGEGESFRESIPLPKRYKSGRVKPRPTTLKEIRKWCIEELKAEQAPQGFETDDVVTWYAFRGYQDYKKTGIFSYVVAAEDKDALSTPCLLISYGKEKDEDDSSCFKFPNAWLIPDSSVSVGEMDLVTKVRKSGNSNEVKATGLKWLVTQAFLLGDSADGYFPYKYVPKECFYGKPYGDESIYKDFKHLDNCKDLLQTAVDKMFEWFPYGLQYVDHFGKEQDIDTFTWMEYCFQTAYMTRNSNDTLTFKKLCDAFKVDISKILCNNEYTPPYEVFNEEEGETIKESTLSIIDNILNGELKSYKSSNKPKLVEAMDSTKNMLLKHKALLDKIGTKLVQKHKTTGEIKDYIEEK